MSIGLRRLSYEVLLTPQVSKKKRCLQGAFFCERVAVLRSLTATTGLGADEERGERKDCVRVTATEKVKR